ncbi:MAG: TlpA family protein disulfide reductase [Sandaracinus sp.]|nr:TlpA family protein disulfide reductase [Myxococcales bacterium]MCB9603272.1 TlpA family protein disulfide reductase [Sandaracinus sp.]MCB9613240.1 TlpA family protein disulfide reductase [Sandaracinus sp.]
MKKNRELLALALVLVIGAPLVAMLGMSLADGARRTRESVVRSMIGDERYETLATFHEEAATGDAPAPDEAGFPHYYNPRGGFRRAPDFTLNDRWGHPFRLSEQRGKVVVMNFWSITCPPCLEEMPSLEELAKQAEAHFGDDVVVVAVSTDAGWDAVRTVLPADPELHHLFDPDKSTVEGKFGTSLYPETWIIDREGFVRFRFDGGFDWSSPVVLDLIQSFR